MDEKCKLIRAYSFMPGWKQSRRCDGESLKSELMGAMKITSRASWMMRRRGEIETSASEKAAIEVIFRKYGVKSNIWGYETEEYRAAESAGI